MRYIYRFIWRCGDVRTYGEGVSELRGVKHVIWFIGNEGRNILQLVGGDAWKK